MPHSVEALAAPAPIKEDQDGGWPAEFQRLRQLPFDQKPSTIGCTAGCFSTPYDVVAGVWESRTRRGTIRRTAQLTRQKVRIEEWPKLRRWIEEELIERGMLAEALQHMRCIEAFMAAARHPSIPRILRTAGGTVAGAIAGGSSPLLMPLTAFLPFRRGPFGVDGS